MSFLPHFDASVKPQRGDVVVLMRGQQFLFDSSRNSLMFPVLAEQWTGGRVVSPHLPQPLLLGFWQERRCFVSVVDEASFHQEPFLGLYGSNDTLPEAFGLRQLLGVIADAEFALASRALQFLFWLEHHQFCGRCGGPTRLQMQEPACVCEQCAAQFFPRISPCVIVIVVSGRQCLLARNAQFREGLYSVLAGFIEAGESAEQAVLREVKEEVGLEVHNLRYITSQSWPFPSQLMLGFIAESEALPPKVDGFEIIEAQWFDADKLPLIPNLGTLSRHLIDYFRSSLGLR